MKHIQLHLLHNQNILVQNKEGKDIALIGVNAEIIFPNAITISYIELLDITQATMCHQTLLEVLKTNPSQ